MILEESVLIVIEMKRRFGCCEKNKTRIIFDPI
jgi:hypothetical protein